MARNEWGVRHHPLVPAHEILGTVSGLVSDVEGLQVGDLVGVGVMAGSCSSCRSCAAGDQKYCCEGFVPTYNRTEDGIGGRTFGGYCNGIVVDSRFVLKIPKGIDPASTAPLLCAGVTVWSPLRHWHIGLGSRVGIVGLGGRGHVAIKIARALGAEVSLFTTSSSKLQDAIRLGTHHAVLSRDGDAMSGSFAGGGVILRSHERFRFSGRV